MPKMNAMALVAGSGVRIGLEDNIFFDEDKTKLCRNKDLVKRILEITKPLKRSPCSQKEICQILGLE